MFRYKLRTLLVVLALACMVAGLFGWAYRIADETHRAIHPEHFDKNGNRIY